MWSFAGFMGALVGLGMLAFELTPYIHFLWPESYFWWWLSIINFKKAKETIQPKKKNCSQTGQCLIWLGIIGFVAWPAEGVMFDWRRLFQRCHQSAGPLVILGTHFFYDYDGWRTFLRRSVWLVNWSKTKSCKSSGIMISAGEAFTKKH
jgi:hypothetical protein